MLTMSSLTKSKILLHKQCPRSLLLQVNSPELASEGGSSVDRFRDGNAIGYVARKLHPSGVFIETLNQSDALSVLLPTVFKTPSTSSNNRT
jgi:hypothetical protein